MNKVYLIGVCGSSSTLAATLSLATAQEMLMDYAYDNGLYMYNLYRSFGRTHEVAMSVALNAMEDFYIWEKDLI